MLFTRSINLALLRQETKIYAGGSLEGSWNYSVKIINFEKRSSKGAINGKSKGDERNVFYLV